MVEVKSHKRVTKNKVSVVRNHSRKSTKASRRLLDYARGKKDSLGIYKGADALRRGREINKLEPGDHPTSEAQTMINLRDQVSPITGKKRGADFNKSKVYRGYKSRNKKK